jgi:hypothetical protein
MWDHTVLRDGTFLDEQFATHQQLLYTILAQGVVRYFNNVVFNEFLND